MKTYQAAEEKVRQQQFPHSSIDKAMQIFQFSQDFLLLNRVQMF